MIIKISITNEILTRLETSLNLRKPCNKNIKRILIIHVKSQVLNQDSDTTFKL